MEIGLTYHSKDPKHTKTRDFVMNFIRERGILAKVIERDRQVEVPRITINGCCLSDQLPPTHEKRRRLRFPTTAEIARALEQNFWSL